MPEEILMKFLPTRLTFFRWYFAGVVLFALWFLLFFDFLKIAISKDYLFLMPLLGLFLIIISEIRIRVNKFYITNNRIIEKKGLLSMMESSVGFDRIANYRIHQNFLEKILNIGTIEIESVGGSEAPEIVMKGVRNMKNIKMLLDKLIIEWKNRTVGL